MRFLIHSWSGQIILPLLVFMMLYLIKFALGKKIKIRLADFLLPFLFFSIHSLSVNVFGISILPFVIFAFSAYGFLEIVIMAFYEGKFMIDKFFDRYLYIWDLISIFLYALLVVLQLSKIINTVI
ncbi:DUF3397 domain-containing protein [Ligilactobacillus ruminis]|uniref:DUF3397 domain-containing protein n=1 Tax=Ligilactobacillus ruminis TaxID=1623 RepID=UPI0022E93A43|nr:DUF3397 domain-containing protein [Ligilactobacillus ruminis]